MLGMIRYAQLLGMIHTRLGFQLWPPFARFLCAFALGSAEQSNYPNFSLFFGQIKDRRNIYMLQNISFYHKRSDSDMIEQQYK